MSRELDASRLRFEQEWQRLRASLRREAGGEPSWSRWTLPVLGVATGLALAYLLSDRRQLQTDSNLEHPES